MARSNLDADIASVDPSAKPANPPDAEDADLPFGRSKGGVLMHIYEELSQHLGQMELTRDLIVATSG